MNTIQTRTNQTRTNPGQSRTNTGKLRVITVAGLLAAAAGIMVQRLSGVDMPAVPPGVVILVVPALLITVLRWRWLPALGVLAGASELTGLIMVGAYGSLLELEPVGVMIGAWLRLLGSVAAIAAGVGLLILGYRRVRVAVS